MFEKLRGRIRDFLPSSDPKEHTQFQPKAHPIEQLEKPNAIEFPKITNRYRWINYGFNRKERRCMESQLRRKNCQVIETVPDLTGRSGRVSPQRFRKADRKTVKIMLKANPRNIPSNGGVNNPYYGVNV